MLTATALASHLVSLARSEKDVYWSRGRSLKDRKVGSGHLLAHASDRIWSKDALAVSGLFEMALTLSWRSYQLA